MEYKVRWSCIIIVVIVIYQGEMSDSSLELNQNTVIQVYHNLDSSNQIEEDDSSSNQQPLSQEHILQLNHLNNSLQSPSEQHRHRRSHPPQPPRPSRPSRQPSRPTRPIECHYQLGDSPSTRDQASIRRLNEPSQRRSNPMHLYTGSNLPDIQSDSHEENEYSEPQESIQGEVSPQRRIESGRQGRLGVARRSEHFDIGNWLNPQPAFPRNKNGNSVLNPSKRKPSGSRVRRERSNLRSSQSVIEQETIDLFTLPQVEIERVERMSKAIERGENELQRMRGGYQRRFSQVRLSFIDSFMPQPLKIKNNPYNLLKYMNKRLRI